MGPGTDEGCEGGGLSGSLGTPCWTWFDIPGRGLRDSKDIYTSYHINEFRSCSIVHVVLYTQYKLE